MRLRILFLLFVLVGSLNCSKTAAENPSESINVNHTYEARIRLNGKVSTTRIQASDAGQAKKLVQAQFGPSVTVLSVKRVQ